MAAPDSLRDLPGLNPDDLAPLSSAERQSLLDLIRAARVTQEAEYRSAMDQALSHVPALLRGTIRKIISG